VSRPIPTPEVHTNGGVFSLDIVDDDAPVNEKRWRIMLKNGILHIVLFDDAHNMYRGVQIERRGTQPDVYQHRDVELGT
jgi:hypothetical protein